MSAPYVRTPTDLADLRLWLLDQWRPGGVYATTAAPAMTARLDGVLDRRPMPNALAGWEERQLSTATLWWVGEEMVDVLMAAAPTVPDDTTLTDLPRPSSSGLVVFAKPWVGVDADREAHAVQVDAILWGSDVLTGRWGPNRESGRQPAVSVSSYRKLVFEDGLSTEIELAALLGCLNHGRMEPMTPATLPDEPHGTFVYDNGRGDGTRSVVVGTEPNPSHTEGDVIRAHLAKQAGWTLTGCSWAPLGRSDWPLTDPLGTPPWPMDDATWASYREDRRVLAALWTLLRTKALTATTVRDVDRAVRRRTERAGVDRALAAVRTVTLRQPDRPAGEPADATPGRRYSHRWIVQPHFCWQPYGPGRSQRKLIMRGPYVKGPTDAPLHTPTVVRAWTR